nr:MULTISPECIES: hypothetical protein [unclassified Leucobacter]
MKRIDHLRLDIAGKPELRWGVVSSASPLAVQLDGDAGPLAGSPSTLVGERSVGDRVQIAIQNRRATIIGVAGGIGSAFALKSQLEAWAAIDGTHAWVESEKREYVRAGGKWRRVPIIESGTVRLEGEAGVTRSAEISFTPGLFPAVPALQISALSSAPQNVVGLAFNPISASGATIWLRYATATAVNVHWTAVLS